MDEENKEQKYQNLETGNNINLTTEQYLPTNEFNHTEEDN